MSMLREALDKAAKAHDRSRAEDAARAGYAVAPGDGAAQSENGMSDRMGNMPHAQITPNETSNVRGVSRFWPFVWRDLVPAMAMLLLGAIALSLFARDANGTMGYPFAKVLLLLALAALLGMLTGWWLRRHYDDVTSDRTRLEQDWQMWREAVDNKLAQRPELDRSGVLARLSAAEEAIRGMHLPIQNPAALNNGGATPPPVPAGPNPLIRAGSRNLLMRAAFGPPDDLKLLKGVAKVLEKKLHDIGVYYFWQIAEWEMADVLHVDAQLTPIKGRIKRDAWVPQAKVLASRADAARRPEAL